VTTTLDTAGAALLAELTARGIELRALGDRLRFRPRKAMTPDLFARVASHKLELLTLLTITKTPAGGSADGGFGCGDVAGDVRTATAFTADESRMLADALVDVRAAVERIKRVFPSAELVSVRQTDAEPDPADAAAWVMPESSGGLPPAVADLARARDGWKPTAWRTRLLQLAGCCEALNPQRAAELRRAAIAMTPALAENFEERAAIIEFDGRVSRMAAEAAAWAEISERMSHEAALPGGKHPGNCVVHGTTVGRDPRRDRDGRAVPLPDRAGNGHRREPALATDERRTRDDDCDVGAARRPPGAGDRDSAQATAEEARKQVTYGS